MFNSVVVIKVDVLVCVLPVFELELAIKGEVGILKLSVDGVSVAL